MYKPTQDPVAPDAEIDRLFAGYLAVLPELDPLSATIAIGLWRHLAEGQPVSKDALSGRLGMPREQLDVALAGPLAGTYAEDDQGRVRTFWGLSLSDQVSPHRLLLDDRTLYAWCAVDTLFLPLLIGQQLVVESTLTTTDTPIRLEIHPDRLGQVDGPEETAVSFVPAAPEGLGDSPVSIMSTYCHHELFFPDSVSGSQWAAAHGRDDLVILRLADAFDVCQRVLRAVLGDSLD